MYTKNSAQQPTEFTTCAVKLAISICTWHGPSFVAMAAACLIISTCIYMRIVHTVLHAHVLAGVLKGISQRAPGKPTHRQAGGAAAMRPACARLGLILRVLFTSAFNQLTRPLDLLCLDPSSWQHALQGGDGGIQMEPPLSRLIQNENRKKMFIRLNGMFLDCLMRNPKFSCCCKFASASNCLTKKFLLDIFSGIVLSSSISFSVLVTAKLLEPVAATSLKGGGPWTSSQPLPARPRPR